MCHHEPCHALAARRGFTLVEMLVVIGIIGVLAAIIFPVFASVRDAAHTTTCAGNLRQISLAITQYVQDYNGYYPHPDGVVGPGIGNCGWAERVYPYTKSTEVFQCPAFDGGEFRPGCPPDGPDTYNDSKVVNWDGSYDLGRAGPARTSRGLVSQKRLRNPSDVILALDGLGKQRGGFPPELLEQDIEEGYVRHRGGLNALFFDGHIKWFLLSDLDKAKYWEREN